MLTRTLQTRIEGLAAQFPALAVVGPRQSGKTTLVQAAFSHLPYRSLESPDIREFATTDPRNFLDELPDGAILDEVQRVPALLSYLQESIDRDRRPGRWVLAGSQSCSLLESITKSLAGRIEICRLLPLSWAELASSDDAPLDLASAIIRGGYPALHARAVDPTDWFESYITAYVERDVQEILRIIDPDTFHRFVQVVATRSGTVLRMTSIAPEVGVTPPTIKTWLGILEGSGIIIRVPRFHDTLGRRFAKAPKLHFVDSGLLCHLLGIRAPDPLARHPQRHAIFESWVASEIVKSRVNRGIVDGAAAGTGVIRDHFGHEVDLACESVTANGKPILRIVEAKHSRSPTGEWLSIPKRLTAPYAERYVLEMFAIHSGTGRQNWCNETFLPWREIHSIEW